MPTLPTPGIQRLWKSLPGEPAGDAGDPYTGYDRFGRTEAMRWIKPDSGDSGFTTLVNVQWGYNRASQKTWRKDVLAPASAGQDQSFGYDALYQVTERQRGLLNVNATAVGGIPAQAESFSYDETGNWITYRQRNANVLSIDETRVNNQSNQMTQVDDSSAGVSYDANGNMLSVPTGDDLTGPSQQLTWDAWNRLVKVSDASDTVIASYQYDGTTRRTTTQTGGVTRHCYYDDQWRSIEERLDAATTAERQNVWHPVDRWELMFRDRSTANDGTLDERLYSLKDQLDPVAVCDTTGAVVERYDYTAFGMATVLNADFTPKTGNTSAFGWNFLFHAEFTDTETGWFNYGYRYYVPALGRWLSRDPIREAGGANLFRYTNNNSLNVIDYLGLDPMKIAPKLDAKGVEAAKQTKSISDGAGDGLERLKVIYTDKKGDPQITTDTRKGTKNPDGSQKTEMPPRPSLPGPFTGSAHNHPSRTTQEPSEGDKKQVKDSKCPMWISMEDGSIWRVVPDVDSTGKFTNKPPHVLKP